MKTTNVPRKFLRVSALSATVVMGFCGGALADERRAADGSTEAVKEKASRTPAQTRLDSQLVYALRRKRGEMSKDIPREIDVKIREDGRVLVDLEASVSKDLLALIEKQGGQVVNNFPAQNAIRALVPMASLETVAEQPGVRFIRPAVGASTQK